MSRLLTVRPFSTAGKGGLNENFRVYLAPAALLLYKLKAGDAVTILVDARPGATAIAWPAVEKLSDTVIQTSRTLQELAGVKLGEKVSLQKAGLPPAAVTVYLDSDNVSNAAGWEWFMQYPLERTEHIAVGLSLTGEARGEVRTFKVVATEPAAQLVRVTKETIVRLQSPQTKQELIIPSDAAGGLHKQITRLNQLLTAFKHEYDLPRLGRQGGILLYGASGTGKTLLLEAVASISWPVHRIDGSIFGKYIGETEQTLKRLFDAANAQPSIILIDDIDTIAPRRRDDRTGAMLASLMDSLKGVLVLAATNKPNDIDPVLRRPGRLESEVEIPIPDATAREEILNILSEGLTVPDIPTLALRTHGYVGADLQALLKRAVVNRIAIDESLELQPDDIELALISTRPTAMREIFLEPPHVLWSDIGGGEHVKAALREAVEWPLQHGDLMKKLGITPRTGVLLYGPPGCSKTLTAQALATESGLNFIAVRGAELVNQYVGESERAVREVFRKAREAAPSIIFFDEIDSIAQRREGRDGLNILTTLLNEMDGIEPLRGVIVLAATNKPALLDAALMRPGRLETLLYVGPPDVEARLAILRIRTKNMPLHEVDLQVIAARTDGFSGAEIVNACERAGRAAMRRSLLTEFSPITSADFDEALTEIVPAITLQDRAELEQWRKK